MNIDREALDTAVGRVLFNVSNYPAAASPYLLGRDIGPLRNKVVAAVVAALTEPEEAA